MAGAPNNYVPHHQPTGADEHGRAQDGRYEGDRHLHTGAFRSRTGAEIVSGPDGIAIAREFYNSMARLISAEPERFAAFAHL
jgi:hypothetical protein